MTIREKLSDTGKKIVEKNALYIDFLMSIGFYAFIIALIVASWFGDLNLVQIFIGPALVFTLFQGMKLGLRDGKKYYHEEVVNTVVEIVEKMKNGP